MRLVAAALLGLVVGRFLTPPPRHAPRELHRDAPPRHGSAVPASNGHRS